MWRGLRSSFAGDKVKRAAAGVEIINCVHLTEFPLKGILRITMIHRRQTLGCQFDTNSIFSKGAGGAESKDKSGALEGLNVTGERERERKHVFEFMLSSEPLKIDSNCCRTS